jgi:hypothetical protein
MSEWLCVERDFLEEWLQYAGTPIGQECCGRARSECCGCPDPVYPSAEQVIELMASRHRQINETLRDLRQGAGE